MCYKRFLQIVKCITKGREPASCTLFGLLLWQKMTTGSVQGMEKGLFTQILQTVQTALAGQTGADFSELIPGGAGLLTSRLLWLLQGSQPSKHSLCKPQSSPLHRAALQKLLIGTAGTWECRGLSTPPCSPAPTVQPRVLGISEIHTSPSQFLSCSTEKSSWNIAASCLSSSFKARFCACYLKDAYKKGENSKAQESTHLT